MNNKSKLFTGIVVLALVASAAFYFLYFIQTPIYAANQIREAIKTHDQVKFQRYVDVNSVMENAFEDIIKAESKINNDNIFSNPFALGILHMLKPAVVDLMSREALDRVAAKPATATQQAVDPVPDAMRRNMERHVAIDKFTLKDLQATKQDGAHAVVSLLLYRSDLDKNFVAEIAMEVNQHGDWQAKRVANLAELIVQLDAAKKAKLAANNEPVIELMNNAVNVSSISLSKFTAPGKNGGEPEDMLKADILAKNHSGKTINRIYYDVLLLDEKGEPFYSYPEKFQGSMEPGQILNLITSKRLNEMLPDDKKVLKLDLSKQRSRIQITYIAFDDGSVLEPSVLTE